MQQQKLTIYTSPTCHFCREAKEYFKENDIQYEEKDVLADASARAEMVEKSHQMGVPVIMIGDEFIVGFEKGAVQKWLDLHMK